MQKQLKNRIIPEIMECEKPKEESPTSRFFIVEGNIVDAELISECEIEKERLRRLAEKRKNKIEKTYKKG